jgi:3-oxoacyl-(acyl-carrier-protein) synthase
MSDLVIRAASYLGPEGHGNDRTGLRAWPPHCAAAFRRGDLQRLHWSLLLPAAPARLGRMDLMCRLGLLAVALLEAGFEDWPAARRDRVGVCVETYFGALGTDVQFLQTPRPTLFTYSLPSTVIGEICIHYRLKGPVLCLIAPSASARVIVAEAVDMIEQGEIEACLCLACEAAECGAAGAVAWPPAWPAREWYAGALLLAKQAGETRERPLGSGTLKEMCLRLCHYPKGAC